MMKIERRDYFHTENCPLKDSFGMVAFILFLERVNGDACTTGCGFYNMGKCQGYRDICQAKKMSKRATSYKQPLTETNAQIAERLGVSKRQVAKMRKKGEL
jgi:xanthine dehydrogenase iron-sulfur cluster and FAD-binding subunit A